MPDTVPSFDGGARRDQPPATPNHGQFVLRQNGALRDCRQVLREKPRHRLAPTPLAVGRSWRGDLSCAGAAKQTHGRGPHPVQAAGATNWTNVRLRARARRQLAVRPVWG